MKGFSGHGCINFVPMPSKELSYVIGVRYGDLNLNKKRYRMVFGTIDTDFFERVQSAMRKLLGKRGTSYKRFPASKISENEYYLFEFGSKMMFEYLETRHLPPEHRAVIEEYPVDFLKGLYDSEGWVSYGEVSIATKNRWLLPYVKSLLRKLGINSNFYLKKDGMFYLRTYDKASVEKFSKIIGFSIGRKQKTLEELLLSWNSINRYYEKIRHDPVKLKAFYERRRERLRQKKLEGLQFA